MPASAAVLLVVPEIREGHRQCRLWLQADGSQRLRPPRRPRPRCRSHSHLRVRNSITRLNMVSPRCLPAAVTADSGTDCITPSVRLSAAPERLRCRPTGTAAGRGPAVSCPSGGDPRHRCHRRSQPSLGSTVCDAPPTPSVASEHGSCVLTTSEGGESAVSGAGGWHDFGRISRTVRGSSKCRSFFWRVALGAGRSGSSCTGSPLGLSPDGHHGAAYSRPY